MSIKPEFIKEDSSGKTKSCDSKHSSAKVLGYESLIDCGEDRSWWSVPHHLLELAVIGDIH